MTGNRCLHVRNTIAWLATTPLLWLAPPIHAQSAPTQSPTQNAGTRPQTQDNDTTRAELARFDQFLDSHREVADQLRRDPSLVNSQQFLDAHPALQTFLQDHPGIREEITENPNAFMRQENRFDRREDARNRDATRGQLAAFDQFLDNHREVSEQLRRDPSLVKNQQFVENHPALQTFLQEHPEIRTEITQNPNAFMAQEQRFDRREDAANQGMRDRDTTRAELARFDQFLDGHREISEQLRKDPSLVKNQQFVENHPALQTYLQQHPAIRTEITQDPNAFMRQEDRFDRRENATNQGTRDRDDARRFDNNRQDSNRQDADNRQDRDVRDRDANRDDARRSDDRRQDTGNRQPMRDRDATHGQVVSFDQFLDKHREIDEQVRRDPSLLKNQQFLDTHPALQSFLQAHQGVRAEVTENPNAFMQQEKLYESQEKGTGTNMGRSAGMGDMGHEQASFGDFLGGHSSLAAQISKNPSLVKNQEFMASHPELQSYLKAHPTAQAQMTQNPGSFIKAAQQYNSTKTGTSASGTATGTVKTTTPDATKPPKP